MSRAVKVSESITLPQEKQRIGMIILPSCDICVSVVASLVEAQAECLSVLYSVLTTDVNNFEAGGGRIWMRQKKSVEVHLGRSPKPGQALHIHRP